MSKHKVIELSLETRSPKDFPTYQAFLDDIHHRQSVSRQRLQDALELRLNNKQLAEMLGLAWHFGHTPEFERLVVIYIDRLEPNRKTTNPSPFHMACRLGALAALNQFLSRGLDLEEPDQSGRTALETYHFGKVYEWLVEHGANVDCSLKPVWTPLKTACLHGNTLETQRLLDFGATVNKADEEGRSALWTACNRSRVSCVKMLLQAGADPNQADHDNRVPLMLKLNLQIATLLLQHGADPHRKDLQGWRCSPTGQSFAN